jgi:peptidoglycan/LPS O-acetylase OafA/YrhL
VVFFSGHYNQVSYKNFFKETINLSDRNSIVTESSDRSINYRPDIDGLRAIAVLAVIGFHYFPEIFKGGFIGVDIFFVISGFLICSIIINNLETNTFSYIKFYSARIRRIFPSLAVILIFATILGYLFFTPDEYRQLGKHIFGSAFYGVNLIYSRESGYFDFTLILKPLLHLWSLAIEEQFYFFLPAILVLCKKFKIKYCLLILILLILSLSYSTILYLCKFNFSKYFYYPHVRFWELFTGCIIYNFSNKSYNKIISNIISFVSYTIIFISFITIDSYLFPGIKALIPVIGSMLCITVCKESYINKKILSNKFIVSIGLISYPLYLWHWLIYIFYRLINHGLINTFDKIFLLICSVILSILTYFYIEKPIRYNIKYRNIKTVSLPIILIFIGLIGFGIYFNKGLPNRSNFKQLINQADNLEIIKLYDESGLQYISDGFKYRDIIHCRFTNLNSNERIAIFGDSHALAAFHGISNVISKKNIDTLYLGRIGNYFPFIGLYNYISPDYKNNWNSTNYYIYNKILNDKKIIKVFIISRGVYELTGSDIDVGLNNLFTPIPQEIYRKSIQLSIDLFVKYGKKVYFVTENPVLPIPATNLSQHAFEPNKTFLSKKFVIEHQKEYLNIVNSLKNVTIINSLDLFCPDDYCLITDSEGYYLYRDQNHLSKAGSKFLAENLLYKYLIE